MANRFNINTASKEEIAEVPQVGEERAEAIVRFREERGGIDDWDDLQDIPGLSTKMIKNLQNRATLEEEEELEEEEDEDFEEDEELESEEDEEEE